MISPYRTHLFINHKSLKWYQVQTVNTDNYNSSQIVNSWTITHYQIVSASFIWITITHDGIPELTL